MVEEEKGVSTKKAEPQKGAKLARTAQTRSSSEGPIMERGRDHLTKVPTWNPPLVLNGSPLLVDSSIRDFQQGKAGYIADALEQPLLLPDDMDDLRLFKLRTWSRNW